jgi:hypothetical protein
MALLYGPALLRVTMAPGTRILDTAKPPEGHVIRRLKKEFGRDVLTDDPRKVLPTNKRLTLRELIALFRFHYQPVFRGYREDGTKRRKPGTDERWNCLKTFRSLLIRYGFHGYGNPEDGIGIVVFAPDRLIAKEVAVVMPQHQWNYQQGHPFIDSCRSLDEFSRAMKDLETRFVKVGGNSQERISSDGPSA